MDPVLCLQCDLRQWRQSTNTNLYWSSSSVEGKGLCWTTTGVHGMQRGTMQVIHEPMIGKQIRWENNHRQSSGQSARWTRMGTRSLLSVFLNLFETKYVTSHTPLFRPKNIHNSSPCSKKDKYSSYFTPKKVRSISNLAPKENNPYLSSRITAI